MAIQTNNTDADLFDSLNYVSRGGQKLAKALDYFNISPQDRVCIDCGASTGGFTDCLLQRGASYVYAVDVGYGQLAWTLRNDPRVKVMERTNIRYVTPDMLTSPDGTQQRPNLAVIDVSFISLSKVLPVVYNLMATPTPEAVCLIKPQFEAGKGKVGKGGVVRDSLIHEEVLNAFMQRAADSGFTVKALTHSPIKGPKGNIEYLGYLVIQDGKTMKRGETSIPMEENSAHPGIDTTAVVAKSHEELDI